jgi:hypothetical protein
MSEGIGMISKGLVQQAIENVANNPQQRGDFLRVLKDNNPEADWIHFLRDNGGLDIGAERYFREDWLRDFWSKAFPVEAIVRQSLIEAIELANRDPDTGQERFLPIDCYWIWTNDPSKFEALIAVNERQVTRIILTPPPPTTPTNPKRPLTRSTSFFIVKQAHPVEEELRQDPQGQWITVRLKSPE